MNTRYLATPIGELRLVGRRSQLVRIDFEQQHCNEPRAEASCGLLEDCASQLTEYFSGQRKVFSIMLTKTGTVFQQSVWRQLQCIPYGETRSYRDVAQDINQPTAVRAVGAASSRNPLPIVVPCHRVVGSDGSLTGFAGGLEAKALLLALERSQDRRGSPI